MSDATDPLAWVDRAEEDLALARSALRRKRPLTPGACFHAQQCAEKYLKATLVARRRDFPKTHDLKVLNDLCAQGGMIFPFDSQRLDDLSAQAVRARYPGTQPTIEEARESLETAKVVRRATRKLLGLKR